MHGITAPRSFRRFGNPGSVALSTLLGTLLLGCGPSHSMLEGTVPTAPREDAGHTPVVVDLKVDGGPTSGPVDGGSKPPVRDAGSEVDAGPATSDVHVITAFTLAVSENASLTADVAGVITGTAIAVSVPSTAVLTALVPTITINGKSLSPVSGVAQDFSSPVTYEVVADDGSTASYTVTVTAAPVCQTSAASCSPDVYNNAVAFAAAHPVRFNGGTWNQYCGVLMIEFGGFGTAAPTALDAYRNSTIVSTDPTTAPVGAFHYWSLGSAGHVGVDLLGQGAVVFMASSHVAVSWNPYIGVNSVDGYSAASGGSYLGWSMEYNGHGQTLSGGGACGAAVVPNGCAIPQSPTETTGVPDQAFVMRLQMYAASHGYAGAINGDSDAATWAGVQAGLGADGYTGPVNGLPGPNTYKAFQTLAAQYGYAGPINGVLGPNGFRGFATFLNQAF